MSNVEIARLREGECFGEMTLLVGEPRSATVTALERTECIRIRFCVFAVCPLCVCLCVRVRACVCVCVCV